MVMGGRTGENGGGAVVGGGGGGGLGRCSGKRGVYCSHGYPSM